MIRTHSPSGTVLFPCPWSLQCWIKMVNLNWYFFKLCLNGMEEERGGMCIRWVESNNI